MIHSYNFQWIWNVVRDVEEEWFSSSDVKIHASLNEGRNKYFLFFIKVIIFLFNSICVCVHVCVDIFGVQVLEEESSRESWGCELPDMGT